jgi:uncharacterized LabA/DUF88 family protein
MADIKGFIPPKVKNDLTSHLVRIIKNQRVGVFIDAANLYYSAQVAKLDIDYHTLAEWFQEKAGQLSLLNFYSAFDPEDKDQLNFLEELKGSGYNVVSKPIKVFGNVIKGNMDIELCVDALGNSSEFDIIILISGDGDFQYLVKELERQGKSTVIAGVGGFTSFELHQQAENFFFLNRISNVWQKKNEKSVIPVASVPKVYADMVHEFTKNTQDMEFNTMTKSQQRAKLAAKRAEEKKAKKAQPKDSVEKKVVDKKTPTRKQKTVLTGDKPDIVEKTVKPRVKVKLSPPKIFLS